MREKVSDLSVRMKGWTKDRWSSQAILASLEGEQSNAWDEGIH